MSPSPTYSPKPATLYFQQKTLEESQQWFLIKLEGMLKEPEKMCVTYNETPRNAVTCSGGMSRILFPLSFSYLSVSAESICAQRYC